jgi:hypothetical protein
MKFNADLVVLSACETGFGEYQTGNGISSLAQSFMYAGTPSLLVSLWQVNDMSTSVIMKRYYQELQKGKTKSVAIQQAKLAYLKEAENIAAHPAFWAAFIQLGNIQPIQLVSNGSSFWIWGPMGIGMFALMLLAIIGFLRGRSKASSNAG